MPVTDGTITGYLPVSDTDFFRYEGQGPRDLTVEVTFPARVRGKVAAFRPAAVEPVGSAEAKKPRQTVTLAAVQTAGTARRAAHLAAQSRRERQRSLYPEDHQRYLVGAAKRCPSHTGRTHPRPVIACRMP